MRWKLKSKSEFSYIEASSEWLNLGLSKQNLKSMSHTSALNNWWVPPNTSTWKMRRIRISWPISFSVCQTRTERAFSQVLETVARDSRLKCKPFPNIFMFVVIKAMRVNWVSCAWCTHKAINISFYAFQGERDGSNEYSNYQPGSLNTTDQLIKDLDNIDIVFHIGDTSYANGYISQWDQFTSQVEPIASTVPYMTGRFVPFP